MAKGQKRSETQLLNDSRRRPTRESHSDNMDVDHDEGELEERKSGYRTSPSVVELHSAAASYAQRVAPGVVPRVLRSRNGEGNNQLTTKADNNTTKRATRHDDAHSSTKSAPSSSSSLTSDVGFLDLNNFTLDGVTIESGEIVTPTMKRGHIDLFLLYELVVNRFGGFDHILKKQWLDLARLLRIATRMVDATNQFRSNPMSDTTTNMEEEEEEKEYGGKDTGDDDTSTQLHAMAEQMRKIYRSHLLPYERHIAAHAKEAAAVGQVDSDTTVSVAGDSCDSSDLTRSSGRLASSSDLPLPCFSMGEIRRWSQVAARKQREAQLAAEAANANNTSQHARAAAAAATHAAAATPVTPARKPGRMSSATAGVPTERDLGYACAQCKVDSLAPSTQCYQCKLIYHWSCLSPPLLVPPILPWHCPDCTNECSFGFGEGDQYDMHQFEQRAHEFKHGWIWKRMTKYTNKKCPYHAVVTRERSPLKVKQSVDGGCICAVPDAELIKEYWSIVETGNHSKPVTVEYGSDIDTSESGSGFPSSGLYARSGWNLNNLPTVSRSILKHLTNISGVTSPWMYIGMCFSTFAWHAEDHYSYSINYVHQGQPKQWYGVPSNAATGFEAVARLTLPHLFSKQADLMFQMVTMLSPRLLREKGVPVYATTQQPGEFVLTFPQAYHGGFNMGVNIAEAVNFAPPDWLPFAIRGVERYRAYKRMPVFSADLLMMSLARDPLIESDTAAWLLPCLRHSRAEELVMREHLRSAGLTHALRWTHELHLELFGEDTSVEEMIPLKYIRGKAKSRSATRKVASTDQCIHCRHAVHISAVWCKCQPGVLACLRHAAHLCACGPSKQTLLMRYHMDEFDRLIRRLEHQLDSLTPDQRVFYRMNLPNEDEVETIADILDECAQCLEDTEIPIFDVDAAPDNDRPEPQPSYANAPVKARFRKTERGSRAFAQTQALHKNFTFLRKCVTEQAKAQDENNFIALVSGSSSTALEVLRGCLYPIPAVLTPLVRHVIPSPSSPSASTAVHRELNRRIERWMKQVKPFLVEAVRLKKAHAKQARAARRKQGIDTDSSDSDDHDSDDESERMIEPIHINGAPLDGHGAASDGDLAHEDRLLDRTLDRIFSHAAYADVAPRRSTAVSQRSVRLTLTQLEQLLTEGRALIWTPVQSREVNLVFYKLSQWSQLVDKIQDLGRVLESTDSNTKEELTTARQLIRASIDAPIDYTSAASSSSYSPSKGDHHGDSWSARMAMHMKNLKQQIDQAEKVEAELEALFAIDIAHMSLEERENHTGLPTRLELYELQERVNALPVTFPLAARLTSTHARLSQWLRRTAITLDQPLSPVFTADQIVNFSSSNRPWQSSSSDPPGLDAPLAGDIDAAQNCLTKLEGIPFKDPIFQTLTSEITPVRELIEQAKRLLFLSPSHSINRDRDAFTDEMSACHAESQRRQGPSIHFTELNRIYESLTSFKLKSRAFLRRVERMMRDIAQWQTEIQQCMKSIIEEGTKEIDIETKMNEFIHTRDELGILCDPSIEEIFSHLRRLIDFKNRYRRYFTDALPHCYPSNYFNFKIFEPLSWLSQLERAFQSIHPIREEWKNQTWREGLAIYINQSPVDVIEVQVEETKLPPISPKSSDEPTSSSSKLTPAKRPASDSVHSPKKMKHEPRDEDGDTIMADATATDVQSVARSDPSIPGDGHSQPGDIHPISSASTSSPTLTAAPTPTAATRTIKPTELTPTKQAKVESHPPSSRHKATLRDMLTLLDDGRSVLPAVVALCSGGSPALQQLMTEHATEVEAQLSHIDELCTLILRVHQYLAYLDQLKHASHTILNADEATPERIEATRFLAASAAESATHTNHLDCTYYSSPSQCPFYTIVEVEKLYVICKSLESMFGVTLVGSRLLKEVYTQAYIFQLVARRLKSVPQMRVEQLSTSNVVQFDTSRRELQRKIVRLTSNIEVQTIGLCNIHSPIWQQFKMRVDAEHRYDININLWIALLHAEYKVTHPLPSDMPPLTMLRTTANTWIVAPNSNRKHQHHLLLFHPLNHATYQDLATRYSDLNRWTAQATQCVQHLRGAINWLRDHSHQRVALSQLCPVNALAYVLTVAEMLLKEGIQLGLHSPLLRKLRQGLWLVRVSEELNKAPSIEEITKLIATNEACRAVQARLRSTTIHSDEGNNPKANFSTPAPTSTTGGPPSSRHGVSPLPTFSEPLVLLNDSSALHVALAADPANEFDDAPCLVDLLECVRGGWDWLEKARSMLESLANLDKYINARDADRDIAPTLELDAVIKFTQKPCACINARCAELKMLNERIAACQTWANRIRNWTTISKRQQVMASNTMPVYGGPASSSSATGTGASSLLDEIDIGENRKLHTRHLPRLINAGRSVLMMTKELIMLHELERISDEWVERLDVLFQPRHSQLQLRFLLKSLLVPITGEQEKEKMRMVAAEKNAHGDTHSRHPLPDSNGLYCICKRPYEDTLFMIACG